MPTAAQITVAETAYHDNADYRATGSVTKAAAFMTACTRLLQLIPKRTAHGGRGGEETEFDPPVLQAELRRAEQWHSRHQANATPRYGFVHFENFGR